MSHFHTHSHSDDLMIFSGNASKNLANKVADALGVTLGNAVVDKFKDGEIQVVVNENVRGKDIFIIQSTFPPSDNLMELVLLIDALKRSSADRITAVLPYFGYARQDRRSKSARVPISAKVVANMLQAVGLDRILSVDIHAEQIQGFFDIPFDNAFATKIFLEYVRNNPEKYDNIKIVSPDMGGVVRARSVAKNLGVEIAVVDKRRPKPNVAEVMNIIGEVDGKHCILVDDIMDTGGTMCQAATALVEKGGASKVSAFCVHPLLSGNAIENINNSAIDEVIVTDTIPLNEAARNCPKIKVISLAPLLAQIIKKTNEEESVSDIFRMDGLVD
ncbi:ribose-phosphate pyrophosphokinase [Francisella frigiditurris]|uniref:Ribose-phosphate pyrophosphokinase n=1 Tax=Francisella frigiditurris TaxID=1542390 RepID=A0A1J0KRL6_9GAMM|nr:ribose-phosphate pyrophosphokinase [Francisella frigiditurris]APC96351.1 ribose-phosphate diphosphokinase family protein [Francisella frigiditurris]